MRSSSAVAIEMRLLLDTAVLIWAVDSPELLTKRARLALQDPHNVLELSTISLAEIAIKTAIGKLQLSLADTKQALADLDIRILPYAAIHAFGLFNLPAHHSDPFDRQIITQALAEKIPVVTSDEKFRLYKGVKIIW